MYSCFSQSGSERHFLPRFLEISALWASGFFSMIFLRSSWDQRMKAFIGRFTWFFLFFRV